MGKTVCLAAAFATLTLALAAPGGAEAGRFKLLYTFHGGSNGAGPSAAPVLDSDGNIYGTTFAGGAKDNGTVFKLAPDGSETLLSQFDGHAAGAGPIASLWRDANGDLFGTTPYTHGTGKVRAGGTVFEITASGTQKVLHRFTLDDPAGYEPQGGVIADSAGNLYGTTELGGAYRYGTAWKLAPGGAMTVLHGFAAYADDGAQPIGTLTMDASGNLYGATESGGAAQAGGTVFKIAPDGTESVLYSFGVTGSDGFRPGGGVLLDAASNFYGTTTLGGRNMNGAVYKLAPDGTETILHSFEQYLDGAQPMGSLVADAKGNLYGTTSEGGLTNFGTVFEVAHDGTFRTVHTFNTIGRQMRNGGRPQAGLTIDTVGSLYGTTVMGGGKGEPIAYGTVFKIDPR
jgi:uncharacterized repeat protein (TIGR03803 family)